VVAWKFGYAVEDSDGALRVESERVWRVASGERVDCRLANASKEKDAWPVSRREEETRKYKMR
jgi:hypothetical protein